MKTSDAAYAERLLHRQSVWWKRWLGVQAPYRWNLRRLKLGRTLDVGCGIGRNLVNLDPGSLGIDHNQAAVDLGRARGLPMVTPEEFAAMPPHSTRGFDSLLVSHVLEHMMEEQALALLRDYVELVRPGGRVVVITPQEAGFRSDPTHVEFVDHARIAAFASGAGLDVERLYSFPLPRWTGRLFKYNEFVGILRRR